MLISDLISANKIFKVGRTYLKNDVLHMNFSGSGVKVLVEGETLNITFVSRNYSNGDSCPCVCVIIDGIKHYEKLDEETKSLKYQLSKGCHDVHILKNSESPVSQTGILDIEANNFLDYSCVKKKRLEFYGDSLTCGFGVLSECSTDKFTSKTESFADSHAFIAASILDCDYSVISVSGFPVYKSRWNAGFKIDSVADMISICDYEESMDQSSTVKWDNSLYIPDCVIINLGSNDESYFTPGMEWIDKLIEKYGDYSLVRKSPEYLLELQKLKDRIFKFFDDLYLVYPDTKIVYATGILEIVEDVDKTIDEAVCEYKDKTNKEVYRYHYKVRKHFNSRGAVNHPGKKMQEFAGVELANYLFDIL